MMYGRLAGLRPEDFEHPGEKTAMAAMRKIPLLDVALAKYIDIQTQMTSYADAAGNYFRITEKTNPRICTWPFLLKEPRSTVPKTTTLFFNRFARATPTWIAVGSICIASSIRNRLVLSFPKVARHS